MSDAEARRGIQHVLSGSYVPSPAERLMLMRALIGRGADLPLVDILHTESMVTIGGNQTIVGQFEESGLAHVGLTLVLFASSGRTDTPESVIRRSVIRRWDRGRLRLVRAGE